MANEILSERRGAAFIVTFNRPDQANALTSDMATQLFNLLKPVTTDHSVRTVLLKGAGGNFMDGIDMMLYAGDYNTALERANQMFQPYHGAIRELLVMDKPVIAAVDGIAAGAGLSFMLAADFVLAATDAKLNTKFTSFGATPDGASSALLVRKAGANRAFELLSLSENFSAAEGEKWNLVNRVVEGGKLQEEALAWTERFASGPTRAYAGVKKLVIKAFEQDTNTQIGLEHNYWGQSVKGFDFREAVRAHFAKRPAKFTGA